MYIHTHVTDTYNTKKHQPMLQSSIAREIGSDVFSFWLCFLCMYVYCVHVCVYERERQYFTWISMITLCQQKCVRVCVRERGGVRVRETAVVVAAAASVVADQQLQQSSSTVQILTCISIHFSQLCGMNSYANPNPKSRALQTQETDRDRKETQHTDKDIDKETHTETKIQTKKHIPKERPQHKHRHETLVSQYTGTCTHRHKNRRSHRIYIVLLCFGGGDHGVTMTKIDWLETNISTAQVTPTVLAA